MNYLPPDASSLLGTTSPLDCLQSPYTGCPLLHAMVVAACIAVMNPASGTFEVIIKCQKEGGAWPAIFTPDLKATAGEASTDCTNEDSAAAYPTVTPLPAVRVVIDEPISDVCSTKDDDVTFTANVYNDNADSTAKLNVTANWRPSAGGASIDCTVTSGLEGEYCFCFRGVANAVSFWCMGGWAVMLQLGTSCMLTAGCTCSESNGSHHSGRARTLCPLAGS